MCIVFTIFSARIFFSFSFAFFPNMYISLRLQVEKRGRSLANPFGIYNGFCVFLVSRVYMYRKFDRSSSKREKEREKVFSVFFNIYYNVFWFFLCEAFLFFLFISLCENDLNDLMIKCSVQNVGYNVKLDHNFFKDVKN